MGNRNSLKRNYELISTAKNDATYHSMSILRNYISYLIHVSEKGNMFRDFSCTFPFLTIGKYFVDILSK